MSDKRPRPPRGCPSGKVRYGTQTDADWAVVHAADTHAAEGRAKLEARAYPCRDCRGWHLTSIAREDRGGRNHADPTTRGLVLARDGLCCVAGGEPILGRPHRLQPRCPSVALTVANLVTLCGTFDDGCLAETITHAETAYEVGLLVHGGTDPATVPVRAWDGWWLLQADGSRTAAGGSTVVARRA